MRRLLLPLAAAFPLLSAGQSLEERVYQNRRLQAESIMDMSPRERDSLLGARGGIRSRLETPGRSASAPGGYREGGLDSMLAGPVSADAEWWETDSLYPPDTGLAAKSRAMQPPPDSLPPYLKRRPPHMPKRYEQRIFRTVDRSAFSSAKGSAGRGYVLGPGDQVAVFLWGDREKEYSLTLNSEGKVFLEGAGLIPLGGLDLDAAQDRVRERLGRIHSGIGRGTTRVDVSLEGSGPIKVFVLGEVKIPGGYVFTGNTSVLSALYFARGPTDIGSVRNLQLTRGGKKYSLDLYQYLMRGELPSPGTLQDGDILFAPRAEILAEVDGDVGRRAVFELKRGEGVRELLEYAGRPNPTAALQRMTLQRLAPGGGITHLDLATPQEYLAGKAQAELQDGDKLLVQRSKEPPADFMTVSGPVKYPGTYASAGVRTVKDLVGKAGGLREDAYLGRVHVVRYRPDGSSSLMAFSLDSALADTISLQGRDNVILYSTKEMYLPDSVEIAGAVFVPGKYEFRSGMSAIDLVMLAGGFLPNHESGNLLVFRGGTRDEKISQIKVSAKDGLEKTGQAFFLEPRDFIHVPVDPRWYKKEVVTLDGLFLKPGKYALLYPGEKLASVVERAGGFKPSAYVEGGRYFRTRDSVGRIGVDIRQALKSPRSKVNIPMADGDSIYIPARLNTVKVLGEVGFETSILYKQGAPVSYYIEKAGGFTRRSEKGRVVVQYANGETGRDGYFNRQPDAGSVIFVPQGPEPKPIDWLAGINGLLATIGVAAAVILSIQAVSK